MIFWWILSLLSSFNEYTVNYNVDASTIDSLLPKYNKSDTLMVQMLYSYVLLLYFVNIIVVDDNGRYQYYYCEIVSVGGY